jgi:hypothetical protein
VSELRDFLCTHGEGWAAETWTRIGPEHIGSPRREHVANARVAGKKRRDAADELQELSRAAAERLGCDAGQGQRADLLRSLADAGEADAAGHTQVRCPTCGWEERVLHRDHVSLSEWCTEAGLHYIPLRSARRILVELGVL